MTIPIMLSGVRGKVGSEIVKRLDAGVDGFELIPYALGGKTGGVGYGNGDFFDLNIFTPNRHDYGLDAATSQYPDVIVVDFSRGGIDDIAGLCADKGIPFVTGATDGDNELIKSYVAGSDISAVVAPNMSREIVTVQEFMRSYAEKHPEKWTGYNLIIKESHQAAKGKETSGTARAMVNYFQKLGIDIRANEIISFRDPSDQISFDVPEKYLDGHGWHTYTLGPPHDMGLEFDAEFIAAFREMLTSRFSENGHTFDTKSGEDIINSLFVESNDGGVRIGISELDCDCVIIEHNVNGRSTYVDGTLDAVRFLDRKRSEGSKGEVFDMLDVLAA